ncbi:hypothetical protein AL049_18255 [Pseudomonas syringae pv. cerasicola]|nr:hypothetical protein AL049_18255 [Pseudomonas syringae pv. cerasicola]PHN80357.1 hypothetical protein AO252_09920 [Pseudomonas syringae pv. cerasicola]PHN80509.1 hypothetical protein AO272_17325 [Pseudomonas syringae pv. cerasicola]
MIIHLLLLHVMHVVDFSILQILNLSLPLFLYLAHLLSVRLLLAGVTVLLLFLVNTQYPAMVILVLLELILALQLVAVNDLRMMRPRSVMMPKEQQGNLIVGIRQLIPLHHLLPVVVLLLFPVFLFVLLIQLVDLSVQATLL